MGTWHDKKSRLKIDFICEPDMNLSNQPDRKERELEAARKISEALFQHLSVEDVGGTRVEDCLGGCRTAAAGSVLLANPETKELVFYHSVGERPPKPGTAFPWSQGIAGTVFAKGEPIVIEDVKQDQRHFGEIDLITGFHTQDMIALPLKRWEGPPIGVLEVLNKVDGRLNQDDVAILTIIAPLRHFPLNRLGYFKKPN